MSKIIFVERIIGSKAADDDLKGNKVFEEIKRISQDENENNEDIVLDFERIELVNTAFLNNAIGQLFNREVFDISKNEVKIRNMQNTMIDLLRESISVANQKYS